MSKEVIKEEITNPKATIKRLWNYLRQDRLGIIIVIIMVVLSTIATVLGPILTLLAVDKFILSGQLNSLFILLLLLGIVYFYRHYLIIYLIYYGINIRKALFNIRRIYLIILKIIVFLIKTKEEI